MVRGFEGTQIIAQLGHEGSDGEKMRHSRERGLGSHWGDPATTDKIAAFQGDFVARSSMGYSLFALRATAKCPNCICETRMLLLYCLAGIDWACAGRILRRKNRLSN